MNETSGIRQYRVTTLRRGTHIVSFHAGKSKHKDGSDFFDGQVFGNKKNVDRFVRQLVRQGYVEA